MIDRIPRLFLHTESSKNYLGRKYFWDFCFLGLEADNPQHNTDDRVHVCKMTVNDCRNL